MEQKTKEKLFRSVRKLITLLRFPQQEALRSGHQILGETNREGRREQEMPKGWGDMKTQCQMPAPLSMAIHTPTTLYLGLDQV